MMHFGSSTRVAGRFGALQGEAATVGPPAPGERDASTEAIRGAALADPAAGSDTGVRSLPAWDASGPVASGPGAGAPIRRLLVVDDLPEICDLFRELLREAMDPTLRLTTEISSRRALALVQEQTFDVVVSDFRMPEVDGVDVLCAALSHNPGGRRVLMTGYNDIPTQVGRIQSAKVDAFLRKPMETQGLLTLLLDLLYERKDPITRSRKAARQMERTAAEEGDRIQAELGLGAAAPPPQGSGHADAAPVHQDRARSALLRQAAPRFVVPWRAVTVAERDGPGGCGPWQ